jgi:SAM domain (Sterile alpha motif)/Acyl-CoA dehydrogenase, C-terminal domain
MDLNMIVICPHWNTWSSIRKRPSSYLHVVGACVDVLQLIYKAAGGAAVYQKGPLDRCLRDILTANQHLIATARTYEVARRAQIVEMDTPEWLRTLGLEQYAPMFHQNEIDYEVLPELADADLERLGVPMGHRKRLLRAISALSVAASAAAHPPAGHPQK